MRAVMQRRCGLHFAVVSLLGVAAAGGTLEADNDECSLSALQLRGQRRVGGVPEDACSRCLRSCVPGEDAAFRGNTSFTVCAKGCGCPRPPPENLVNGSIFGEDKHEGLVGATDAASWGYWLWRLHGLRQQIGALEGYGATASEYYSSPSFKRGGAAYSTVQTMSHDRMLYDPVLRVWTAEKYLEDLHKRYGGVDQVLIWPSYPNIGADSRSNMDMLEAMPGGLAECVKALKAAQPSLLVQIAYMPWDISTNGTTGPHELERYVDLMMRGGVDGVNLDTMTSLRVGWDGPIMPDVALFDVARQVGMPALIIEPELGPWGGLAFLNVTLQGWVYQLAQCPPEFCIERVPFKPLVSLQKWLVRGTMPHICGRWSTQRSQEMLTAYFNAIGYTPWENIWGLWNGVNDFDGELWKRAQAILKHLHPVLVDPDTAWLPFYPLRNETPAGSHVFASKFAGKDLEVWLLINTGTEDAGEADWALPAPTSGPASAFYDLYSGDALHVQREALCLVRSCEGQAGSFTELVRVPVEARGVGAVLRVLPGGALPEEHQAFMRAMKAMTSRPLASFSSHRVPIPQQHLVQPALGATALTAAGPRGAVLVRGSSAYEFRVFGAEIEDWWWSSGQPGGADVQYPWEALPTKYHEGHRLSIGDLWVDRYPVTNRQFLAFLRETAYEPGDAQNFLRHWDGLGCRGASACSMPPDIAREPVVFVGLDDARAYCIHRGGRLPHEWEWQYVAQAGNPQKLYPWGSEWRPDLMPPVQPNVTVAKMTDVGQWPGGASKDGVEDLVGLIWHWTDEYVDEHTRAAVLRGGPAFQAGFCNESARYQPWYFPGHAMDGVWDRWDGRPRSYAPKNFANLYRLTVHGKYLLMAPSLDRAGTIGFRCVADASLHDTHSG